MPPSSENLADQPLPQRNFLTTHWSEVVSAGRSESAESTAALERLCRNYWYPLFAYVRRRGYSEDQAKDLTQAFFAQVIRRQYIADADPERGRFRTFLLKSLNHFLANEWDRVQAQRRGGGIEFVSLDYAREQEDQGLDPGHNLTPERMYERRWAEAVLARVLDQLRAEFDGPTVKRFEALKGFLTEDRGTTSYLDAARQLGMTEQAVKSAIHRLRQRWRELLREEISSTVQVVTGQEVEDEIRYLIGVLS